MAHQEIDDEGFNIDVPELIYALAERFEYQGIPTGQAKRIAAVMLQEAMDQPDEYLDQLNIQIH